MKYKHRKCVYLFIKIVSILSQQLSIFENMIHIGNQIKQVLEERGLTISEFARRINFSRENVYSIFKRPTMDIALLQKINKVLDYDFFQYYDANTKVSRAKEDTVIYKNSTSKTNLLKVITSLQQELEACKMELDTAKKEVVYLKKINELLEKKKK